eukprot:Colp12_sorted_trinity150504_noHs@23841
MADTIPEDVRHHAETIKNGANEHFKNHHYAKAIEGYTEAIKMNPYVAAYFANRSFAYLRSEAPGAAKEDASKALELDKNYIKAYYRRAAALLALGKYKDALADFKTVARVCPKDKDAQEKLKACEKVVKQNAFFAAIASEYNEKSVTDSLEVEHMILESDYKGPHLPAEGITREFVMDMIETFRSQKLIAKKYAYTMLVHIKKLLQTLPTVVDFMIPHKGKVTVCGDVHGQYYDLLNIFKLNGYPSEDNPYIFNGDFVDRGSFSVEVIFTLFGFKLLYPNHFHLVRGNHESVNMNKMYGFDGEVKSKYADKMAEVFHEVYRQLPLGMLVQNKVLILHGGLFSRDDVTVDELRKIDRNREPPESGLMCEMLWSDPQPEPGRSASKRGVGCQFGPDVTDNFLKRNNLELLIRSHEVKNDGYEVAHDGKCITIFSAPNYCDQMGNKGAFIHLREDCVPTFTTFDAVPHPNVKPMAYAPNFNFLGM